VKTQENSVTKIPPMCRTQEYILEKHGHRLRDDYFWLKEKSLPEVRQYVEAENEFTAQELAPLKTLQEKIFQELKARLEPREEGVPEKKGFFEYSYEIPESAQYRILWRRALKTNAPRDVLLDENQLAKGCAYFRLLSHRVSPDTHILAYATDTDGSEHGKIYFKNLVTGELYDECLEHASGSMVWAEDSKHLYYIKRAPNDRPYRLYRHKLGTHATQDELLFQEDDSKFFLGVSRSKDGKYIFLVSDTKITTEVYFIKPSRPTQLQLIHPRTHGVEIKDVHHWFGSFFILTNLKEPNFRVLKVPVQYPNLTQGEEIVRGSQFNLLEALDVARDYFILDERNLGLPRIRVIESRTLKESFIEFDQAAYQASAFPLSEFESTHLRVQFSSPKSSRKIFEYDLKNHERRCLKDTEIGGGFREENYVTERIMIPSHDGVEVPVTLLYRKDLDRSRPHPLLLYGYGSYGHTIDAAMNTSRFSLVDRGFISAIAHIRGGSDMGRWWYEDGKFLKKKNTFLDFIGCAEALVKRGYTSKGEITIMGGSAGGLLVGAAMNLNPDLFKVVLAHVPFVDVVNTMLDDSLLLTVTEYDEWGNPNQKEFFDYMLSYSPYDNLKKGEYPHVFLSAGWNDPRVTYWEPAKFCAKLRVLRQDSRKTLLYTNMGAGHGGASGRFSYLEEQARYFAFALSCYGIKE